MKSRLLLLATTLLCLAGSVHAQSALQFSSGKWLSLGYNADYNTPTFSIEGWVYPTSFSASYQCIASSIKTPPGNFKGYGLYVVNGHPEIGGYDSGGAYHFARASAQILLSYWSYIKGYYDGSTWHLLVNGKEVASTAAVYAPNDGGGGDDKFYVGADYTGDYFVGKIDNVRYYDVPGVNNYRASYPDTSDPHLILAYYFNAGSGTTVANDAVNHPGYTLTLNNSPAWVDSPINYSQNAINLDGSNDYVQVANDAALQSANFSVEVWANRTSGGTGFETVLSYQGAGNHTGYAIYVHDNKWKVAYGDGSSYQYIEGPAVVNGAWTHVAATYDGSSVVLYINGAAYSTTAVGSISPNTTTPLYLGADYTGFYFHGSIDEVRVWNSVRTGAEIGANWQSPIGLAIPSGLVAYLSFDQGYVAANNAGLVNVIDGTENGFSAILSGFALTGPVSNFAEPWQPSAPEIAVQQPAGTELVDGNSSIDFGFVIVGSSVARTFTIANTGTVDLTVGAITKDGAHASDFTVDTSGMSGTVAPGNSTTFTVTYSPGSGGPRSAAIHIANNDSYENPFDIALTGTSGFSGMLTVTPSLSASDLVTALLGSGVTVVNTPTLVSVANQSGTFSGGGSVGLGIESGVVLTTGNATLLPGANSTSDPLGEGYGNLQGSSQDFNTPLVTAGDSALDTIVASGNKTVDAAVLEFQFMLGDGSRAGSVTMNYLFGSDEYIEFLSGAFNDVFAFYVDGQNIALVPGTSTPVSVNTINPMSNASLYRNNVKNQAGYPVAGIQIVLDGLTTVLSATANIGPGVHIMKFAIADVGPGPAGDPSYDSAVFLQGGSFIEGAPEIAVEQPAGTDLVDGTASIDFGSVATGSSSTAKTFTIKNPGAASLTVVAITKDGTNPGDFTVDTTGMSTTVTAGGSTTFTVTFTPGATGARSAAIHITSDDGDENPFDITLTGSGSVPLAPEIAVEQPAGTDLVDGTASIGFGSVAVGSSSAAQTFTIKNTGTGDLTVGAITKDGTNPGDFTVDTTGMSATVPAGGSTTFTVTYTPGAAGARSAAIHIANNDSDENPFDIALTGSATAPSGLVLTITEIGSDVVVTGSGSILLGDEAPFDTGDVFNPIILPGGLLGIGAGGVMNEYAILDAGGPIAFGTGGPKFATSSTGDIINLELALVPPQIGLSTSYISGAPISSTATFANQSLASMGLTPGSSFVWTTTAGSQNLTDTITLNIVGAAAPEIAVEQPAGTDLVDGTASIGFGSVAVGSSSAAQTFTIRNTGTGDLTVGTITKDGTNPGDFTVDTTGMSTTVAPGGSTTFTVTFTPGATGARSAAIHIANNDSDENPFDIALTGNGTGGGPTAQPDQIERPTTARVVKVLQTTLVANDHPLPLTITGVANPQPAGATVVLSGPFVVYTAPAPDAGDGSFEYTVSDGSTTAVGTVTVKEVGPSGPNAQNTVKIEVSSGNAILTFIGVPGRNYQVQRAGALTGPWTNLGGVQTAPASGVISYTDSSPPSPSFYRVILVP